MNNYIIRQERREEEFYVENMTRESFWNVYRPGCEEHYLLHKLRKDPCFIPELNLVLEYKSNIIAHVVFINCHILTDDGQKIPTLSFGPICVENGCKFRGVGTEILTYGLKKAKSMGYKSCVVLGNPKFYHRFGFKPSEEFGIYLSDMTDFTPHFQIMEFEKDALKGIKGRFDYPNVYFQPKEEIDEFDKLFVPKKKLSLPGQLV